MNVAPLQQIEVTDPKSWRSYAQAMPEPHILQSWAWGLSKRQTGWSARRLAWGEEGVTPGEGDRFTAWAAAAMLVRRIQARLPVAVAYVPKGPLLDWSDQALAAAVLRDIESAARRLAAAMRRWVELVAGDRPDERPGAWCNWCPDADRCPSSLADPAEQTAEGATSIDPSGPAAGEWAGDDDDSW